MLVYRKEDRVDIEAAHLQILHAVFVDSTRTADHQTTAGIRRILEHDGNVDDLVAYFEERNLPLDDIGRQRLARRVLEETPLQGYLTISNALQWRLQYGRAIALAGDAHDDGLEELLV